MTFLRLLYWPYFHDKKFLPQFQIVRIYFYINCHILLTFSLFTALLEIKVLYSSNIRMKSSPNQILNILNNKKGSQYKPNFLFVTTQLDSNECYNLIVIRRWAQPQSWILLCLWNYLETLTSLIWNQCKPFTI